MFHYTSSFDGKLQEFPNRDALLLALESEENRSLQLNVSTTVSLEHVDQEGNVLEQAELAFPMSNGQTYQEALADFGQTAVSRNPLLGLGLATSKSSKETVNVVSQRSQKFPLFLNLKNVVLLLSLILAGLSFMVSLKLNQTVKSLKTSSSQPKQTQTAQFSNEHAVDVFSRYFLGTYFRQSSRLEDYVAPDIEKSKLQMEKVTPSSVLLESIKQQKNGQMKVTYVCSLKDNHDRTSTRRVTFTVKSYKTSDYQYIVTQAPKLTNYPK